MFGANPRKSAATIEDINRVFAARARGRSDYTVVYGYATGSFSKPINYAVGFSIPDRTFILVPMTTSGEPAGDAAVLKAGKNVSCRKNPDGSFHLESKELDRNLDLTVLASAPDSGEGKGLRAVNQYEEAANFLSFIKSI